MEAKKFKALQYAFIVSFGGFIFGLDAALISGTVRFITTEFQLSDLQIGAVVSASGFGVLFALLGAGYMSDTYGRKKTLQIIAFLYLFSAVFSALAPNFMALLAARFIGGLAFTSLTLASMYIGEIAPSNMRGKLVSMNQINIVLGLSAAYFINYLILQASGSEAEWVSSWGLNQTANIWRWMLGAEIIPAAIWFGLLFSVPESPRWLVMKGKIEAASEIFTRIQPLDRVNELINEIRESVQIDEEPSTTLAQLKMLFAPVMRTAFIIGLAVAIVQQVTGINAIMFYAPTVFEQVGIGTDAAFAQAIYVGLGSLVFTILALLLIDRVGRRPLILWGLLWAVLSLSVCSIGFGMADYKLTAESLAQLNEEVEGEKLASMVGVSYANDVAFKDALKLALGETAAKKHESELIQLGANINGTLILVGIMSFICAFHFSIGPIMWVLFSEIFPIKVRGIAIPFFALITSTVSYLVQQFFPWQLSVMGASEIFLFYAVLTGLGLMVLIKFLPETKNKTIEEIEVALGNNPHLVLDPNSQLNHCYPLTTMKKLTAYLLLFVLLAGTETLSAQGAGLIRLPDNIAPKDRICFALYTVHAQTLKLTAQFYPIQNIEPFEATLEIEVNGEWQTQARSEIIYPGYTAQFRIENWADDQEHKYRVNHNDKAYYEGIVRRNPMDKEEFVLAAFTCNSIYPAHGGDISKQDIVENMKKLQPDLLFFSGDQVYDHSAHYLYWLKFGQDFGEIIRNTPTITIPDDHDIGQANLWGAGGKKGKSRRGISGGYYMPVDYIKEVERAQTSHLPDPYDPTPLERGIGVYYTDLTWGGISFAILEDRKFKSGLEGVIEHDAGVLEAILEPGLDTRQFDVPEAKLLGDRQLQFLEDWTTNWEAAEMKTVLSQTIFAMSSNYSGKHGKEVYADFDTNGWPQTGRNKALATIRKSYSIMVAGDQHLGTLIHHGIGDWNDAGYSFCTPAIANYWLRWWQPKQVGANRSIGQANNLGEFKDGFQNKITMLAVANPTLPEIEAGGYLSTRAAGFGIIRYHKPNRTITFECWGRNVDITDPQSQQYEGWPVTISQTDNYLVNEGFELATLEISEANQVVTIVESFTNEVVSSLRIAGKTFQGRVPKQGLYSLIIGEGSAQVIMHEIESKKKNKLVLTIPLPKTPSDE